MDRFLPTENHKESSCAAKVIVAMSGGVDSSVAALLLREAGYQVIGITMYQWDYDTVGGNIYGDTGCCSLDSIDDARRVCFKLGIPHYVIDLKEPFRKAVVENFINEYITGRTPNPCVRCNSEIRWNFLLEKARELGTDFVATGHYARIEKDSDTARFCLLKGFDPWKDQSYMLWGLNQEKLSRTLFPVGILRKNQTRQIAREYDLLTAEKEDSQEICFVPDNNYERFLREEIVLQGDIPLTFQKGRILGLDGNLLGYHKGAAFYTVGQRKGLGLALGKPVYVVAIDAGTNIIHVGSNDSLNRKEMIVGEVNWISGIPPKEMLRVDVKIRLSHPGASATISLIDNDRIHVEFNEPQRAITPGQSAVFYDANVVLGGGIIE